MHATTNTLLAQVEFAFVPVSLTETELAYPTLEITYRHRPGYPERGPSWDCGGEPGEGDEVTFLSATLVDGDGLDPTQEQLDEMAADWLGDAGYERACDEAR